MWRVVVLRSGARDDGGPAPLEHARWQRRRRIPVFPQLVPSSKSFAHSVGTLVLESFVVKILLQAAWTSTGVKDFELGSAGGKKVGIPLRLQACVPVLPGTL
jgi:hypothetical protein